jgi:hypothetical protein
VTHRCSSPAPTIADDPDSSDGKDDNLEPFVKRARLTSSSADAINVLEQAEELYDLEQRRQGTRRQLESKLDRQTGSVKPKEVPLTLRMAGQRSIAGVLAANSAFSAYSTNYQAAAAAIEIGCFTQAASKSAYQSRLSNLVLQLKKATDAVLVPRQPDAANVSSHLDEMERFTLAARGPLDTQSVTRTTQLLQELAAMPVTVDAISGSNNGKRLRRLRKQGTPAVATAAEYTLDTWRAFVLASPPPAP